MDIFGWIMISILALAGLGAALYFAIPSIIDMTKINTYKRKLKIENAKKDATIRAEQDAIRKEQLRAKDKELENAKLELELKKKEAKIASVKEKIDNLENKDKEIKEAVNNFETVVPVEEPKEEAKTEEVVETPVVEEEVKQEETFTIKSVENKKDDE